MILYKHLPLSWVEDQPVKQKDLFLKRCYCIRDGKFWFSKPHQLNDPYDCWPFFSLGKCLESISAILDAMTPEELTLVLKRFPNCATKEDIYRLYAIIIDSTNTADSGRNIAMWSIQAMASEIVNVKIANIGVLSLTEDPYNNVMWAQYASNHEGVCIEVNIPRNTRSLKKVIYTTQQPDFEVYEAMDEKHGRYLDLFYTKSKHWSSESEWRMVAREGGEAKTIPGAVVSRIIYGINASDETKGKVAELIGQNIPTSQLKMKRNYALSWDS